MKNFFLIFFLTCFHCLLSANCCDEGCVVNNCALDDCGHVFAAVEFIYWKAHEDNLVFAIDGVATPNSGSSKELDWEWRPGFKVGVGYVLPCCLDSFLNYTWYRGKAKASATSQNAATPLFPTFAPDASIIPLTSASSEWTLHYHTLDLELGEWFCLSRCFLFHPNVGVRAAFTRETDHIVYHFPVENDHNFTQHFNGVGPRIGFNTRCFFCNNFSLFVDGAYALVWGSYDITYQEVLSAGSTLSNTEHNFDVLRNLIDIRLGLDWSFTLCDAYHFVLGAAWEHRLWLKHNQFLRYNFATPSTQRDNDGDLSLYGVDVCLQICY